MFRLIVLLIVVLAALVPARAEESQKDLIASLQALLLADKGRYFVKRVENPTTQRSEWSVRYSAHPDLNAPLGYLLNTGLARYDQQQSLIILDPKMPPSLAFAANNRLSTVLQGVIAAERKKLNDVQGNLVATSEKVQALGGKFETLETETLPSLRAMDVRLGKEQGILWALCIASLICSMGLVFWEAWKERRRSQQMSMIARRESLSTPTSTNGNGKKVTQPTQRPDPPKEKPILPREAPRNEAAQTEVKRGLQAKPSPTAPPKTEEEIPRVSPQAMLKRIVQQDQDE